MIRQPKHTAPGIDDLDAAQARQAVISETGDPGYILPAALRDLDDFARLCERSAREARDAAERLRDRDHGAPWSMTPSAGSLVRSTLGNAATNLTTYAIRAIATAGDLDAYYARAETPTESER